VPEVDLIVHSAGQLVTCASPSGPKRGSALADCGIIADGAVAICGGRIVAVGGSARLRSAYAARAAIDAGGQVVCPGFVDPHTHVLYAGERMDEFELRLRGTPYMEIMAAGGGIRSTMRATRQAGEDELVRQTVPRLDEMLANGTTTVEIKSGYGLDLDGELKLLRVMDTLARTQPVGIVPTLLGAHAVPPEFEGNGDAYVSHVIREMIPAAAAWYKRSAFAARGTPFFCDVFCEEGVFDRAQTGAILRAGLRYGLKPKIHADEFRSLGGVTLACELGAVSADHLDVTPDAEIERLAQSDVVGVLLPAVNFNFGSTHYAPARKMADTGVALALATDMNPGSAPCPSMPLVMAIACRYGRLLPAEVFNAGTINAAWAIGRQADCGSLESGKQADLLVLSAPDYRAVPYQFGSNLVRIVVKAGRVVYENGAMQYGEDAR
jgi:imidazolonepropionase